MGSDTTPERLVVAAAAVTVETASTRCTASSGKVGFCEPKVPPAWAMIRLVPSWASWAWSAPLALSVSPTALTMAATPMIGPEHDQERADLAGREPGPGHAEEVARSGSRGDVHPALVGHDLAVTHGDLPRRAVSPPSGRGSP